MTTMTRIAITGANGFIGRTLCDCLNERDFVVHGLTRTNGAIAVKGSLKSFVVGALHGQTEFCSALDGCDVVIHTAARVHQMNDKASNEHLYDVVNVEGTKRLLEQSKEVGVKHFIFLSTVKVIGERTGDSPISEHKSSKPEDPYAKSKLKAEAFIIEFCLQNDIRYTILRLPLVYGAGVKANFAKLYALSSKPVPLPFKGLKQKRSLLYVENLCSAILNVLKAKSHQSGVYYLSDDDDVSVGELVSIMKRALHNNMPMFSVPTKLINTLAALLNKRSEVARLTEPFRVSCQKFKQDFSWTAPYNTEQAIIKMTKDLRNKSHE